MTTNTKRENYSNDDGIFQNPEEKVVCLMVLEKKPLDNYFKGTRDKKKTKKKTRTPNTYKFREFNDFTKEDVSIPTTFHQEEKCRERSIEDKKLEDKIKMYQKMKENEQRHSRMKQAMIEKNSLEQQENLIETWFEIIKRRNKLKHENESCSGSSYFKQKNTKYCPKIGISLLSKKFWNDEDNSNKEPKNELRKELEDSSNDNKHVEHIEKKFSENLVFVDDDDDDETTFHGSMRCQQKFSRRVEF